MTMGNNSIPTEDSILPEWYEEGFFHLKEFFLGIFAISIIGIFCLICFVVKTILFPFALVGHFVKRLNNFLGKICESFTVGDEKK